MEENNTSYSLIYRATHLNEDEAWNELLSHYSRFIYYILNELNVYQKDIDDVAQNVMLLLSQKLASYDKEKGKFRTWLRQVITNATVSYIRKQKSQDERINKLAEQSAVDTPYSESTIEQRIESEWKNYITTLAMERIRQTYEGKAVDAFEMGLAGKNAQEIAHLTGLTVRSVYTLRQKVKRSLFLTVRQLVKDLEHES